MKIGITRHPKNISGIKSDTSHVVRQRDRAGASAVQAIQHIHTGLLHFQRTPAWRGANNGQCVQWHSPECSFLH